MSSTATDRNGTSIDPQVVPGALALTVNGERHGLAPGSSVADLVASWCASREGVAVARNREVVPRSGWAEEILEAGDEVEIVTAAAGG
ncbi:MAG TPA: sulfur carrier protein ThiS [Acidimicrobiales bacterium]|nr:sulfur carrier protein ThiS [Acidimicrobiales bacterium]